MPYFYGSFEHALDDRGRVAIPARFRRSLQDGGVLRASPDGCAELYATADFEAEVADRLGATAAGRRNARRMRRAFLAGAFEVELDAQGRIVLPQPIRAETALDGRVLIVGCGNYVELWDPERWSQEERSMGNELDEDLR
jgi:MraZ protein